MFGILMNDSNIEKIVEHQKTLTPTEAHLAPDLYLNRGNDWYYIRGYVDSNGRAGTWAAYPAHVFVKTFDFDPDKIKTDWDQIVRK